MHHLIQNALVTRLAPDQSAATTFLLAAGTSDVGCTAVDTREYDSVMFIVLVGAIAAGGTVDIKAQQSTDTTDGNFSDLAGTAATQLGDTDDDKMVIIDIHRPTERYVRIFTTRTTANSDLAGVIAIQYNAKDAAPTQGSTVKSAEYFTGPAEGTA